MTSTQRLWIALQARIRQIHDLLSNALVGADTAGNGIAEGGMVTARPNDNSTCAQQRGISARNAKNHQARVALHRWESEGGAISRAPESQLTYTP